MKLHLGSGEHYYPLWLNVDCDPIWPTDLLCNADELPLYYEPGTFEMLYMGHFLEHLVYDSIPWTLSRVLETCTPDARIAVVGPCYDLAKKHAPDLLYNIMDRGETTPGAHRWTATAKLTKTALESAGLQVQSVDIDTIRRPEWPNPSQAPWQCAFLASRM